MRSDREILLSVDGVRYGYGDLIAVWDVTMQAHAGEAVAVVGRNGAGKTTLMFGLAGLLATGAGRVCVGDRDVTKLSAWNRARAGLCLVPEGKRVFRELTVIENIELAVPGGLGRGERKQRVDEVFERFPLLGEKRKALAGSCSGGQQQMLAIGAALAMRPKVLLVDEPSSGLSPVAVEQVLDTLGDLKREGMAIVLVEQRVEEVITGIADYVLVVEQGHVVIEATPDAISLPELEQRLAVA